MSKAAASGVSATLFVLIAVSGSILAQRPKPAYDPETREGLLIQHIQQETDPQEKLHYMEQFSVQFPTHPAILWVYDQLQPAYMKEKAWDEAMHVGEKRLAAEPENLDAAKLSLKAAETKANVDDLAKWADTAWKVASALETKGGPNVTDAEQTKLYAESMLYQVAEQTEDPTARVGLLLALQDRNPKSPFADNIPSECVALYRKLNQLDHALALAQQTLVNDPDNLDMLMAASEFYFSKEAHERVIATSLHAIEVLEKKTRPSNMTDDEWQKKKSQLLGMSYYMGGVSSSFSQQYGRADQMLRAALPYIAGDANQEAAALYHLGLANYKLADKEPARAASAMGYWRRCATIDSKFQSQAAKNADAVKNEFNLSN